MSDALLDKFVKEAIKTAKIEVILLMIEDNVPVSKISRYTGFSRKKIKDIYLQSFKAEISAILKKRESAKKRSR